MKKVICILLMLALMLAGCSLQENTSDNVPNGNETTVETTKSCKISDDSLIIDDYKLFNLEMKAQTEELALGKLEILFPVEKKCYVYFSMPKDQENYAYRVKSININNESYDLELICVDGHYQKYKLSNFSDIITENNLYEIEEIHFYNEKNDKDNQTYNIRQNITAVFDEEKFYFEQEYLYPITLHGESIESVYQFNKDNNFLVDLWSKVVGDIERLDEDRRSFFYFAFRCYDIERDIYFVPEDILQLDIEFTRLSYEYKGKNKEEAENIVPLSKKVTQRIEPETKHVTGSNDKRSNKRLYVYDTINKLSEADLSKNVGNSNALVLSQAAKQYDWAVQFGERNGYPKKNNKTGIFLNHQYDIDYTKVEDLNAIHIVYRYEGKQISTKTNSLIQETTLTVTEKVPDNASKSEEREYDLYVTLQDESLNLVEKLVESTKILARPLIPGVIILLLVIIMYKFIKSRYFPLVNKCIEKKIKEEFDDE